MTRGEDLAFSAAEYDRRLAAFRDAAEGAGFDTILLFNPASICYLSGFSTINLWDPVCLIVSGGTEPILVFREFETGRFEASCRFSSHAAYAPDSNVAEGIRKAMRHLESHPEPVGLEIDDISIPPRFKPSVTSSRAVPEMLPRFSMMPG